MAAPRLPLVFLLAAAVAAGGATPAAAQQKGRKVAFLVGIGSFKHDLPDLKGTPQRDATELAKVLKDGGFEVVTLTDEKATKAAIEARFQAVLDGGGNKAKVLDKADTVLVALCTHGYTFEVATAGGGKRGEPFIAPYDARPGQVGTMVSLNKLIADTRSYGPTVMFLVDACRETDDPNRSGIQAAQLDLPPKTAVMFSCGRGQVAHQSEKLDGGHGLFTFAVLSVLRGDTNVTGELNWSELVSHVERIFKLPEFQNYLPAGKAQNPFETRGEMTGTPLLKIHPSAGHLNEFIYHRARVGNLVTQTFPKMAVNHIEQWREAAEAGKTPGRILYALCLANGVVVKKDERAAAALLRKAADDGNTTAMCLLGEWVAGGRGGPADKAEALALYRKAADWGDPEGMFNVALAYQSGAMGVGKDDKEALAWFRRSASFNYPAALLVLGMFHELGHGGVEKSPPEAMKLYKKLVELQAPMGMVMLGMMHKEGRGVPKDEKEAFELFKKAATFNVPIALNHVGMAYANGSGTEKDEPRAVWFFRQAADGGLPLGMFNLAFMYENGRGVAQDTAMAVKIYTAAANAGHAPAKTALARLGKK